MNFSRREFLGGLAGATFSGWLGRLAAHAPKEPRSKACILLWMAGGPSHIDTFDPKPDAPADVRGEFNAIETSVPGIQISEHFPRFATLMEHAAILRGMSTLESDHKLATYHVHTGYLNRAGAVSFPSLGALVAKELGNRDTPLPNFVSIGRGAPAVGAGFLGPYYQPLSVTDPERGLDFIDRSESQQDFDRQLKLLRQIDDQFQAAYQSDAGEAHRSTVDRAVRLMNSQQKQAFDLSLEPEPVRDVYRSLNDGSPTTTKGKTVSAKDRDSFGLGCLMARRLVEAGVPFVEVRMGDGVGWDTHRDNFPRTRALSLECDRAMSALVEDLHQRGLLETTLVIWMGEFGRTPQCAGGGRNHWARAWSSVLIGGGIRGGQVIGRTDEHGAEVVDRPISVSDFLATVCKILGIDHTQKNQPAGLDRPIQIVDGSKGIQLISEVL